MDETLSSYLAEELYQHCLYSFFPPTSLIPCLARFLTVKLSFGLSLQQFSLSAPLLGDTYSVHTGSYDTGDKYEETWPGHAWLHTLCPSSLGLCRPWCSPRTYCCLWWWVRSPVPATSPCTWSFAHSGISSLDSLSCQPSLSPVAAWEWISHWAN